MHISTETDNLVVGAARVDIVDEPLHIHRVAGVAINRRGIVALHAVFDVKASFTMHLKIVMAGITGIAVDDQPFKYWCASCRQEIYWRIVGRNVFGQEPA